MNDDHDSAYAGLLVDDAHWAFGEAAHDDPLAGMDTSIPAGVDATELASYCLELGDDALVLAHRLSEWCGRAPDLEEDIALSNIALDLLGQARLLLTRAATADPSVVPPLPDGSPVPPEDALAFFRDDHQFRNTNLVELPNGDFAETICRVLVWATYRLALFERLAAHPDGVVRAVAAKGVKELAYHRDFAAQWFVTLARGTEESRRRLHTGLAQVWGYRHQRGEDAVAEAVLAEVLAAAGVAAPDVGPVATSSHTEHLSRMLAEMQVVARAHPRGRW
ncbi:phenylacetate-CoA oxygenase subunit PaaC [Nocardioides humilatus]|uniref:Phenylacetate-CoA oxygenase subunit PaaC n=1 Tax=Nocardioides humilatus TaxID=2607660 RepID=A0A5B1LES0_9ACTN|nr:1,2-phenylacetyl-CoA epoxidase subunit PaaC [Nocardioides humilatus]KAA1418956.1 phenylacetate-CoA oxygenase subunit PaaC [Nocardioides humilatus]